MSLLNDAANVESSKELSCFRNDVHACLKARVDALFELADALLCEPGPVRSPVDLTLSPEYRRGHGALYGGLNHGRIDTEQLREVLAGLPLPRWPDGRIVLAVDVSAWLRSDATCLAALAPMGLTGTGGEHVRNPASGEMSGPDGSLPSRSLFSHPARTGDRLTPSKPGAVVQRQETRPTTPLGPSAAPLA
ncbi:hypothetical protein HD597_000534 [Nonomuraea thailandensis]|uniref:Transposase IS701-like DDE domain-containing protein n=1 Tax=Nonomuraea thailandensis TaxID=1188745 RepID=A0A9X2JYV0_9ACTN|nr:transposase [Nonomuraea thailandensis]MCP2353514.1 hypothetical protein [Nonomuraea thailandensis]